MSIILLYDTETNGLPIWSSPSEHPDQPHITQLAAELFNEDSGEVLAYMDFLIKPDGWTIPDDLAELTGITTEKASLFGVSIADALRMFISMWRRAAFRVAHNESFDARMVRIEMFRQLDIEDAFHDEWKAAPAFCTQSRSTKIINLPPTPKMVAAKRFHAKSPNLAEAYEFFAGEPLVNAHNAAVDIAACKVVYQGIKARGQVTA